MSNSRDGNLDFLRALAIIAVVLYHIAGMWPSDSIAHVKDYAGLGRHGVTLFFVLSGWLIGGIYWREHKAVGQVGWTPFWIRRWLRTLPPYYVGLMVSYLAVYFSRGERFDFRYLVFAQNYESVIPYYLVSWSLCVEEHFYLILPLVCSIIARLPLRWALTILWTLPLTAPFLRLLDSNVDASLAFGYSKCATHLVSEGLTLGVAAAFTAINFGNVWSQIQRVARIFSVPCFILFVSTTFWPTNTDFYIGQSLIALCCFVWLAAAAGQRPLPFASTRFVNAVAISSYSIYLTHSLAIHVGRLIAKSNGSVASEIRCFACWLLLIVVFGTTFYFLVERPSIRVRDYISRRLLTKGVAPRAKTELPLPLP